MTEIGKNPSKGKRQSDCGGLKVFSMLDINLWEKNVARGPNATSGIIFNEARLQKQHKPHAIIPL